MQVKLGIKSNFSDNAIILNPDVKTEIVEVWQKRNLTKISLNVLVHLKAAEWMEEYSKVELLNYLQIFVISNVLLFFSKRTTFDIKTLRIKTYFYLKYNFVTYLFQTNFSTEKPFVTWQKFLILSLTKTFLSLLKSQKMGGKVSLRTS